MKKLLLILTIAILANCSNSSSSQEEREFHFMCSNIEILPIYLYTLIEGDDFYRIYDTLNLVGDFVTIKESQGFIKATFVFTKGGKLKKSFPFILDFEAAGIIDLRYLDWIPLTNSFL